MILWLEVHQFLFEAKMTMVFFTQGDIMENLTELVLLLRQDDDRAFSQIVERFQPLLMKAAYANGRFDEECYQECLIHLFFALKKFELR